jgi:hypothetical protein
MTFAKLLIVSHGKPGHTTLPPSLSVVTFSLYLFRPGSIQMVHKNLADLQNDYEAVRQLEKSGFFTLQL